MQRLRSWKCESLVRLASALRLSVLVGFAVCAASLWAQPANDNFANAILLEGDFGSVTGSNSDATSESGEPSHAGLPPGPSIWYKWTASSDLPVEFDTFNSTCDPVLAVYTGDKLGTLNMVVANDDINTTNPENPDRQDVYRGGRLNDPYRDNPYLGPAGVKFNAKRGTTYYIAVSGTHKNNGSVLAQGPIVLSWAYHSSGVFRFSKNFYLCTEAESDDPQDGSTSPSPRGLRVTVNRLFGAKGKVVVSFDFTDGLARLGRDYKAPKRTSLIFENDETSKSFVVPIIDDGSIGYVRGAGRLGVGNPNFLRDFTITLTDVQLDPLEDPTVLSPPRLEASHSATLGEIAEMDMTPRGVFGGDVTNNFGITNGVVSFERYNYRCTEKAGIATLLVYRSFPTGGVLPPGAANNSPPPATEIHYTIDSNWIPEETDRNQFDLVSGSDYAHPNVEGDLTKPNLPGRGDFGTTNQLALDHGEVNDTTTDGIDLLPTRTYGTLRWNSDFDFVAKRIQIPIIDDDYPEFNEDLEILLFQLVGHETTDAELGYVFAANLTIVHDDYPAGALDDAHNPDFEIGTLQPDNPTPGADNVVYAVAVQTNDNKSIIVGNFSTYNATPRYGVARVNPDGSLDASFDPGDGVPVKDPVNPSFISSLGVLPSGKLVVGGNFPSFNGIRRFNIAQLNADGSLDTSFNPGIGADGTVWAISPLPNGQIVIAGEFTAVNGFSRPHIARLNSDGSVDLSFDPGTNGPNGTIYALAQGLNASIYIGGDFNSVNGLARRSVAQLSTNGVVMTDFSPITGPDGPVFTLAVQPDRRLLVGGSFANVEFAPRNNIARYNQNGSLDYSFLAGSGADDTVYSITLQADNKIILGGLFTSFNQTRRDCVVRLFPSGEVDTGFMDQAYNQFAGLHKPYYNPYINPKVFLYSTALQPDGKLVIGGSFNYVGGGRCNGKVMTNNVDDGFDLTGSGRASYRVRYNFARLLGGSTEGPGNIGLLQTNYAASENFGSVYVKLLRENGTLGQAEATFNIPPRDGEGTVGIGQSGVDYAFNRINPRYTTTWAGTRELSHGIWGTNNISTDVFGKPNRNGSADVYITIPLRPGYQGDRSFPVQMDMPSYADLFYLGGENIPLGVGLGLPAGSLQIQENDTRPGVIGFSPPAYSVNENATNAIITLTRTNGSVGLVAVRFATTNGTAFAGTDYVGVTNTVVFRDGQTATNVFVPIKNDSTIQNIDRTIKLYLAAPGNGATLGLSNAVLSIIDEDFLPGRINFTSTTYVTNETAAAMVIPVTRNGGSLGVLDVQFATTNLTASAGADYIATNGVLHWDSNDTTTRYIVVRLLHDGLVAPNKQFSVGIFNSTVPGALGSRTAASVTIINDDQYGSLQFSASSYNVSENGGYATITVVRTGGSAETISADFATANGTAFRSFNYVQTNGTLVFAPGEIAKSFTVPIINDGVQDAQPFFLNASLGNFTPAGSTPGFPTNVPVNIVDVQSVTQPAGTVDSYFNLGVGFDNDVYAAALQSDGKIVAAGDFTTLNGRALNRIGRLMSDGTLDAAFLVGLPGANGTVRTLINQTDDRVVVGGTFTSINGVVRNSIARLNYDGTLDTGFNPGSGTDGTVFALAETFINGARYILAGGDFTTVNGVQRGGIIRLFNDATVDQSFVNGKGANAPVFAVAAYATNVPNAGKILVGGDFSAINGLAVSRIARLNLDGTVDSTFNPGTGPSDTVRSIVIQQDGRILIGGSFTNVNGITLNRIARLNADGSIDQAFKPGVGANDAVYTIALQPDNRILLGGQFTLASGVTRNRITRLLPTGAVDPNINFGSGADNFVSSIFVQPDEMIVIAGGFTTVQGKSFPHLARLYGGSIVGSGKIQFDSYQYSTDENHTNIVVTAIRTGGTAGAGSLGTDDILVNFSTANDTAVAGVNYSAVTKTLHFPVGETLQNISIPILNDQQITPDLNAKLTLSNPTAPAVLGDQPTAVLEIRNVDSAVAFSSVAYSTPEDSPNAAGIITIVRSGGLLYGATVQFSTTDGGTAVPGVNYTPVTNLVTFGPGQATRDVRIPIFHAPQAQGDRTVEFVLTDASGTIVSQPSAAVLTIIDVDEAPGQFMFSTPSFVVGEGATNAVITVVRTNGHTGVVSVAFDTVPITATPNLKYAPTNGVLTFVDGETVKSFRIRILEETQAAGDQTLSIPLSNPTGGSSISGVNPAILTILDDDIGVSFKDPVYVVYETNSFITVSVQRTGGTNGTTQVSFTTTNGTALAGRDYTKTAGTLTFKPGEDQKSVQIPILRDPLVTGNVTFSVVLSSPAGGAQISVPGNTAVTVLDVDSGLSFGSSSYSVLKDGTNIVISVVRSNANTGPISVNYATVDGTALGGVDYTPVNGTLAFANGQISNVFSVPIINNNLVQGDKDFTVELFNPTAPAQLLEPSIATITIIDNQSGLRFSSPTYDVMVNGVFATITVERTGYTNSVVGVSYATHDVTAKADIDYKAVSGSLVFTNGDVKKTFNVPIIDTTVLQPDKSLSLTLSAPLGRSTLLDPSAAVLTIRNGNGSLITAAGSELVDESYVPKNRVLESGETVTLLLALRNSAGTNTANLIATLLATNGVSAPSGDQDYGVLVTQGPSVSRSFSFTVAGTNGQTIVATLLLQDGGRDIGVAAFTYRVGNAKATFTSPSTIVINDLNSATPYPASNIVSGLEGVIGKVTVGINGLTHSSASDVGVLLVSPSGVTNTLLMANAGGNGVTASKVNLTFDDAAAGSLPTTMLSSGTFKPSSYFPIPQFKAPAPPQPFGNTLAAFNGLNPNGTWSLYVLDDAGLDSGSISSGWTLSFTTVNPIAGAADLAVGAFASPDPVVASSNLTYTLSVTNYGPSVANSVVVTDVLPAGATYVSSTASQGSASSGGGAVSWTIPSLAVQGTATLNLVVQPSGVGVVSNYTAVKSATTDLNPDDDSVITMSRVLSPFADLGLAAEATPNPVMGGANLTCSFTVRNAGPATASNVMFTNRLPAGVRYVSSTLSQGVINTSGNVVWANLGSVGSGASALVTLVLQPTLAGTLTNTASVFSSVVDPAKANNSASAKTVVLDSSLKIAFDGQFLTISWPDIPGSVLEGTLILMPPDWKPVPGAGIFSTGGYRSVTLEATNSSSYYRYRLP